MEPDETVSISVKFPNATVVRMRKEVARRMLATGQHLTIVHLIREAVDRIIPPQPKN